METINQRFEKVLAHIDENLSKPLALSVLSDIAKVPEYHFDFIFLSLFHTSSSEYIALLRNLEAGQQLGFDKSISIKEVAVSVGYQSETAFITDFTQAIGQSPQAFQRQPNWGQFFQKQQPLKTLSEGHNDLTAADVNVDNCKLDKIDLAMISHQAEAQYLPQTIQAMRAFRQANQLSPTSSRTFNFVYQSKPKSTEQLHIDIAVSINTLEKQRIGPAINDSEYFYYSCIPEGKYASFIHLGSDKELERKLKYLYGAWLSSTNQRLKNVPLIFEQLNITEPSKQATRVYLGLD
ncbi:AraC family transcriptional regulator [Shewanella sp. ENK2]|uniref:AraC family transcriptional regulator n=1 Tax=Shewanella sp. ENK2 TaxID=2775245 RepID=UPI003747F653